MLLIFIINMMKNTMVVDMRYLGVILSLAKSLKSFHSSLLFKYGFKTLLYLPVFTYSHCLVILYRISFPIGRQRSTGCINSCWCIIWILVPCFFNLFQDFISLIDVPLHGWVTTIEKVGPIIWAYWSNSNFRFSTIASCAISFRLDTCRSWYVQGSVRSLILWRIVFL